MEAGCYQGGVDPAVGRELTFALATDSTFVWKSGGAKNISHISMADKIAADLAQTQKHVQHAEHRADGDQRW